MTAYSEATSHIISLFKGIRLIDGAKGDDGSISSTVAINVEASPTGDGSTYYLQTVKGNKQIAQLDDYKIIKTFETQQDGTKYHIVYAENDTQGALYKLEDNNSFTLIAENLNVTGKANAITMNDAAYDVFVFTNSLDFISVCFARDEQVQVINPVYENKPIKGLAIAEQAGSLVIGSFNGVVVASRKGDINDWDYVTTTDDLTKPWYQLIGKQITAIVSYIDGLMVFTNDDSRMFLGNMSDYNSAQVLNASLGGCFSYESWCLHDKYLFFYDDNQKNIYYYLQNDVGQKILGEPIAKNIQPFFKEPLKVAFISFIGDNKNEIWLKIDDITLIYNYFNGEWYQRQQNAINSYNVFNYEIYSCDDNGKIFKERAVDSINCVFDEKFIPARYETTYMDFGNCNYLKELDENPLITYGKSYNNNFAIIFDTVKKQKYKRLSLQQGGLFTWARRGDKASENPYKCWNKGKFPIVISYIKGTKKAKSPNAFYFLKFIIFTEQLGDDFALSQIELRIDAIEKDTLGLK